MSLEEITGKRAFVITFQEMKIYTNVDNQSFFQYVLYESGDVQVNYKAAYPRNKTLAGIENTTGETGIGFDLGTDPIQNKSILYTRRDSNDSEDGNSTNGDGSNGDSEDDSDDSSDDDSEVGDNGSGEVPSKCDYERIEEIVQKSIAKTLNINYGATGAGWATGIAVWNPSDESQTANLEINDKVFTVTLPPGEILLKTLSEYVPSGPYVISLKSDVLRMRTLTIYLE